MASIAAGLVAAALVSTGLGLPAGLSLGLLVLAVAVIVGCLVLGHFFPVFKTEVPRRKEKPVERTFAYRWSRLVQRRAWPAVIGGVVLLVVLAIPVLSLRLGFSDEGNYPEETTTRQAYDLLAEGFGPGLQRALHPRGRDPRRGRPGRDDGDGRRHHRGRERRPRGRVRLAADPERPRGADALQWFVTPENAPQAVETADLVVPSAHDRAAVGRG